MSVTRKRIGFVDFDLNNFHADTYLQIYREELASRGFAVAGATALKVRQGKDWCRKNDVPWFDDVAQLNEHVDYYIVLAPSNPETHWELSTQVLVHGKSTYVDKTFAPDIKTAQKIFDLGDKYGAKIQTTSALRYTNIQDHVAELGGRSKVKHMVAFAPGRSFDEYGIHPIELIVSCMGPAVIEIMRRGSGKHTQLLLNFTNRRTATVNLYEGTATPYAASVTTAKETSLIQVDAPIFVRTAESILDFFETGKPQVDRKESLAVRAILDAAEKASTRKRFIAV